MRVFLNSKEYIIDENTSIKDFLDSIVKNKLFVLEFNNEILSKDKFDTTILQESDKLDLFEITGGG